MGMDGGLAAWGFDLYVGLWDGSVQRFDLREGALRRIDAAIDPLLSLSMGGPLRLRDGLFGISGMACDGRGHLHVADGHGNSLSVFDLDDPNAGRLTRPPLRYDEHFGIDETDDLVDVAVDSAGERIYVAYCDGRLLHALQILDRSFRHIRTIPSRGEQGRRFEFVRAVTCAEGRLVVTDSAAREVQVFDLDGRFLRALGAGELGPDGDPMVALAFSGGLVVGGLRHGRSAEILDVDASGAILWRTDVAEGDRVFKPCSLVAAHERIFALTSGELDPNAGRSPEWRVLALAPADGRILERAVLGWEAR